MRKVSRGILGYVVMIAAFILLISILSSGVNTVNRRIEYPELLKKIEQGEVDRVFRQEIAVENLCEAKPMEEVLRQRVLQLTPFFDADYEAQLMARIPQCVSGRWHPAFTDITASGADKGQGMLTMAARVGFDPECTMAFGDGGNDLSMIVTAGIGVAMGNALDSLKEAANYVTTSVDDHGIRNALRHFGLI